MNTVSALCSKLVPFSSPQLTDAPVSTLFYGDNLQVLRNKKLFKDESIDLCYIDPPFNSKRNYNQIYNRIGTEDRAQAQAFVDTWHWSNEIALAGYNEILANDDGKFSQQTIELFKGLYGVLGHSGLLAYLISMTLRITEIRRVLKPTGSFYLHCDQTAGHYLKLVVDSIFVAQGGEYLNEIIWRYTSGGVSKRWLGRKHDTIFLYSKKVDQHFINIPSEKSYTESLPEPHTESGKQLGVMRDEVCDRCNKGRPGQKFRFVTMRDVWMDLRSLFRNDEEMTGYPTQKPSWLLERIIKMSTNEGDVVLDAFCGCGTTISVAEKLGRQWVGIDITYQAISLILRRLEGEAGPTKWRELEKTIKIDGIPSDMKSAIALAHKKDDRLRKEFEKWAVLTYTKNRAQINEKKGADRGIDGIGYFMATAKTNAKVVFQVKSGGVERGDIAKLRGDMEREKASLAYLITLEKPTAPMVAAAKEYGVYNHEIMGRSYDVIQIVTIQDIVENKIRLDLPMGIEVLKKTKAHDHGEQISLLGGRRSLLH